MMCVLLVEDEDLIRMLLTEVMSDAGFDVLDTPDCETALSVTENLQSPRLIVTDVNLGCGMDGFAFVTLARGRWPTVPVLMMSGNSANFASRQCGEAKEFLPKPFSLREFMLSVANLTGPA